MLGLFNKTMLDQFNDMWPELSGRRDWIGKAITIARDQGANSPAYALKVLANPCTLAKNRDTSTASRHRHPSRTPTLTPTKRRGALMKLATRF